MQVPSSSNTNQQANTPAGNYFWRVQASDPSNGVTSSFSSTFQFRYQPFDMRNAIILDSPKDLGFWDETAKITSIAFSPEAFEVDFDRRTGPSCLAGPRRCR